MRLSRYHRGTPQLSVAEGLLLGVSFVFRLNLLIQKLLAITLRLSHSSVILVLQCINDP